MRGKCINYIRANVKNLPVEDYVDGKKRIAL